MSQARTRKAIETLMKELYEGPPDPKGPTWIVSNGAETGYFGTLSAISAREAAVKPSGAAHSVAEHVAHMKFTLDINLRYAQGEQPGKLDWDASWRIAEPFTEDAWQELRRSLRKSYESLLGWAATKEQFADFMSVCGFTASVAHSAYHLGAIRQLAAAVRTT